MCADNTPTLETGLRSKREGRELYRVSRDVRALGIDRTGTALNHVHGQGMHSVAPTGTISSLIASARVLGERFLTLAALEGKQAGLSLAWMLGLALAAAVLAITGWLALLACIVLTLVQHDIVGWGWALSIAALLSFALAGVLVFMVIQRSRHLLFPATRRQLRRIRGRGESA